MRYRPFGTHRHGRLGAFAGLNGDNDRREAADWRDLIHAGVRGRRQRLRDRQSVAGADARLRRGRRGGEALAAVRGPARSSRASRPAACAAGSSRRSLRTRPGVSRPCSPLDRRRRAGFEDAAGRRHALLKDEPTRSGGSALPGPGELIDEHVDFGLFDAVVTPFNLLSGWRDRNLVRRSLERADGRHRLDPCPAELDAMVETAEAQGQAAAGSSAPKPLAGAGTYAFLKHDATAGPPSRSASPTR